MQNLKITESLATHQFRSFSCVAVFLLYQITFNARDKAQTALSLVRQVT
jgi:hypothetical protein